MFKSRIFEACCMGAAIGSSCIEYRRNTKRLAGTRSIAFFMSIRAMKHPKTTIRIGGVPEHFNTPFYLLHEKQPLLDRSIQLSWETYGGGTGAMLKALHSHELDVAILLTEGAVADIARGSKLTIVKFHTNSPLIWGVHTSYASELSNMAQLGGCRFAISRPLSGSHLMAKLLLHETQQKPHDSTPWVEVGNMAGGKEALLADQANVFLWEKYTTLPLVNSRAFKRIGEYPTPWPGFVLVARQAFIQDHEAALRQVLQALHAQIQSLQANPDLTIMHISQRFGIERGQIARWFAELEWNTDFDVRSALLNHVLHTLYQAEIIQAGRSNHTDLGRELHHVS